MVIKVFRLNRKYTPGMITVLCLFVLSIFNLCRVIQENIISLWQYAVGLLIIIAGLFLMARSGMAANGINIVEVPKMIKKNLKEIRSR
jgi:sulfite exporter TauE/SafE